MSLQAYQRAAQQAESPREAEYRLFGQVTRALMAASTVPDDDFLTRMDALDWNRRLWTALASDCSSSDNKMAAPVRAQIISLSLWVNRHTSAVMRREEEFEPLIEINRIIMQGLSGRPEGA
ncbi:MAG: flagellar FlaF family protein [Brevundimonas sp.]|nr:flagellar FlaF family protein [Brevundimonas sp.]